MNHADESTKPAAAIPTDSGVAGLTTEKLILLTIQEAWEMCGEEREAFAAMVMTVAVNCAAYYGLPSPDNDFAWPAHA